MIVVGLLDILSFQNKVRNNFKKLVCSSILLVALSGCGTTFNKILPKAIIVPSMAEPLPKVLREIHMKIEGDIENYSVTIQNGPDGFGGSANEHRLDIGATANEFIQSINQRVSLDCHNHKCIEALITVSGTKFNYQIGAFSYDSIYIDLGMQFSSSIKNSCVKRFNKELSIKVKASEYPELTLNQIYGVAVQSLTSKYILLLSQNIETKCPDANSIM
uniref:hypothetical protein n=1 Tax=Ningiella ruwaisensis TaxID=2364274 RepID=UPI00109F94FB|nr:hypothetical protein [Ningiella ruwaisensis]